MEQEFIFRFFTLNDLIYLCLESPRTLAEIDAKVQVFVQGSELCQKVNELDQAKPEGYVANKQSLWETYVTDPKCPGYFHPWMLLGCNAWLITSVKYWPYIKGEYHFTHAYRDMQIAIETLILMSEKVIPGFLPVHPTYRRGYWMSDEDTRDVEIALCGEKPSCEAYPLGKMIERIKTLVVRTRSQTRKDTLWNTKQSYIVNTDAIGSGVHWIFCIVEHSVDGSISIYDPLNKRSENVRKAFQGLVNDLSQTGATLRVMYLSVGIQYDDWTCGYHCLRWKIFFRLCSDLNLDFDIEGFKEPRKFKQVIWLVLRLRDLRIKSYYNEARERLKQLVLSTDKDWSDFESDLIEIIKDTMNDGEYLH